MTKKETTSRFEAFTSIKPLLRRLGIPVSDTFLKNNSVHFINIAQFFGVINDNIFKWLIIFLFIDLFGQEDYPQVSFSVGVIFVLPFLLFSNAAGVISDFFSRQRMIALLKAVEVVVMGVGVVAFTIQSMPLLYLLLLLLALQSALFGPPKYSIIPELVSPNKISKANGLITSWTYLGIIIGTFLAGALIQITGKSFVGVTFICLAMAVVGYLSSICIPPTPSNPESKKRINPFFFYEIYKTLKRCSTIPYLLIAICMSAYFLFIGAYFQLNVIPFGMQSLGMSEVGGIYLFFTTSIGIAIGAHVAGRLGKHKIELGLPSMALAILTGLIFLLSIFSFSIFPVIAILMLVGFFGGLMVVPLDSFIQTHAPEEIRGQVVAASNFLSFVGVLFAPIAIRILNGTFSLSAVHSFVVIGAITLAFTLFIIRRFPHYFFNYLCRTLINPMAGVHIRNFPLDERKPVVLIDTEYNWKHVAYLVSHSPYLRICIPTQRRKWYHSLIKKFSTLRFVYYGNDRKKALETFLQKAENVKKTIPCLLITFELSEEDEAYLKKKYQFILKTMDISLLPRKERPGTFKRSRVTIEITHQTDDDDESNNSPPWIPFT